MKRNMLCLLILGLVFAVTACNDSDSVASGESPPPVPTPTKNVLFFLGDGMGIATLTAARIYSVGEDGDLTIDTLPETAFVHTYSNDAQVTDSAPSMSAYMTGLKSNNEVISMSADTQATDTLGKPYQLNFDSTCPPDNGHAVDTLLEKMKAANYGTGIVTTTRVTHATPAATYAHICHRDAENTIAAALVPGGQGFNAKLGDGVDVILGGGSHYFTPAAAGGTRGDQRNLIAELQAAKYHYATNKQQFDQLPTDGSKLIALFTPNHMSYDLDRDPEQEPSLAEMTEKAIDALAAKDKGFFLMVEGGRIDHALHATNARRALQDTVAFDDAIKVALDKMQQLDPGLQNTLIVVTADHDHTLQMNGYSQRTGKTQEGNPGVLGIVKSYVNGANSTDVEGNPYTIIGFGNGPGHLATRGPIDENALESADFLQESVIPLKTETHGGGDVFLAAQGLGAEQFSGTLNNDRVFDLIKQAIDLQ
ncbi:alkaline phosphatase [Chania multitudinisentens RB-25]|uniref:Alkaline phosphatase n=1 Tax=Chania multitudinisentens RB-25 TaxID=1441930 RepID=W0L754_9GAMM|nr:alkaline phosphatase [Chania multitudinisentens]AHG19566.1 alkaline phosphatase [Chania multitudinisentens RB-25]